jgi:hypothetical protein
MISKPGSITSALSPYMSPVPTSGSSVVPFPFDEKIFPKRPIPPGGIESLAEGIRDEFPPLDLAPIAQQCAFIGDALKTGGKDYSQPMWNLTTLAATFLEDGNALAHRMGNQHPGYTPETTEDLWERKNRERKERGLGWPSCKAIQDAGCAACENCPHLAKGKSPLNLGLPNAHPNAAADATARASAEAGVSLNDFYAYMPQHTFIYTPTREPWPARSVNARLGDVPLYNPDGTPELDERGEQKYIPASTWLDQNRPVEQMTWAPGLPMLIPDRLIAEGGWIERPEVACLNLYRPPTIKVGNPADALPWLRHIFKVFGDDAPHIVKWLAHRVQHPRDKLNHALVLGGSQGIGKDTLLEPVKRAVGPWNFSEVSPQQMLGRFNGFLKSVILRVNEARDLGDVNRFQFYDHMKSYIAAPPDVLRVDEKNLREHSVWNCCGVIITTNHKADGIYLPADDRRHYVAWSDLTKDNFDANYWNRLWGWYENGGDRHVAAYLTNLNISTFDPKAPPPKTAAFWDIVDANRSPEVAELADTIDSMQSRDAITLMDIMNHANADFGAWIRDRKNRRVIPHRLEKCGYVPVRNEAAQDGLWVINGSRQVVYAKSDLSVSDRFKAASHLAHPRVHIAEVGEVSEKPTPPTAAPSDSSLNSTVATTAISSVQASLQAREAVGAAVLKTLISASGHGESKKR